MKLKTFLLAAMAAMASLQVQAGSDWVAPSLPTPSGSDPVSGQAYKILNVGAGQFLDGGQAWYGWATSTVLSNSGKSFTLTDTGSGWTLSGYVFISGPKDGKGEMHVDGGTNRESRFFTFKKLNNGFYQIRAVASDANYGSSMTDYETLCWGYSSSDHATAVYATVNPASYQCEWAFLTDEQVTSYNTELSVYKAKLNYATTRSTALGFIANTSAYTDEVGAVAAFQSAIYDQDDIVDAASTVDEVNSAIAAINSASLTFLESVTVTSGFDLTNVWITNPAPGISGNTNGWTNSGSPGLQYQLFEYWNASGASTKQTLKNLPKGAYRLTAIAYTRDNMTATLYAGDNTISLVGCGSVNDRNGGNNWIAQGNGNGVNNLDFELANTTESLEIGLIADNTTKDYWMCWRSFSLMYYGDPINKGKVDLANAVAAAEATEEIVPSAVYSSISSVVTAQNKTYGTLEEYEAAASAINTAINTYATSAIIAAYDSYKTSKVNVLALDDNTDLYTGEATVNVADADYAVNNATTVDAINSAIALLYADARAFFSSITVKDGKSFDITNIWINNPSFENGFTGWTNNGMATQNNDSFEKTGSFYAEKWQPNGTFSVTQALKGMPLGVYQLTAKAKARSVTSAKLVANGIETEVIVREETGSYTVDFACDANANISISYEGTGTGVSNSWMCVDDFHLKLIKTTLPDVVAVTGKMNAEVAGAQETAIETYEANKTVANYNAAMAAMSAAQTSKDAYSHAKDYFDDTETILANTNFYTAAAFAAYYPKAKYDEETLTNDEANVLVKVSNGWHSSNTVDDILLSAWTIGGEQASDFTQSLYINTWSTEGNEDGSNFKTPFYEFFAGDGSSLPATTLTGTLTGLENGLYRASVWVRVRTKNDDTPATDATGISMNLNGGDEVDLTEGSQVGDSRFQLKVYTVEGLVKDGTLNLNIVSAGDNNIHWLSFKDVEYTKLRDLTPEEAAIAPTAIAIYNGEDEVTEPIELDAENTSVTLIPVYTPAEATEGYIDWNSSDVSVATVNSLGEVTAVLPGTATITATSTLDGEVSASVTVNVTFPESSYESNSYVNNGATRTITTLGENLFENGSFEYPNAVAGWKTVGYTTDAVASNFTVTSTGGVNDGAYITTNGGAASSEKTLRKSIAVEVGKTYYFSVYTSGKAPSSNNFQYNALFKMSDATTESGTIKQFEWPQGAGNTASAWSKTECIFTAETPYVGVRMGWNEASSFDNFVLAEVLSTTEVGNVDYATAAIPTANIGTGAFQYSQDAIDAANALVQGTASVEDVENAYTALTTINEPADGEVFNVMITTNDNYGFKENPLSFNADNASGAFFPQNTGIKAYRAQQIKFTKVEGNKYKLSTIDALGQEVFIGTNKTINNSGNTGQIRLTTDGSKALAMQVVPTSEGVYNLLNTENSNNKLGCQDNPAEKTNGGLYTTNSHSDFTITTATKPSVNVAISAAVKYGTRIFPFAPEKVSGVTYYSCEAVSGDVLTLTEIEDNLAANTPYILENTTEDDIDENVSGFGCATTDSYTAGLLTGVYEETDAPVGSYVLQNNDDKVGFYKVAEGKQPNVPANRAYLTVPTAGVKAFFFDKETGINGVLNEIAAGNIYDLSGRKVAKMQKGQTYIIDGKKVNVK